MLADPLVIKVPSLAAASAITLAESNSWPIVNAGDGRSVRKLASNSFSGNSSANPAQLTISHSVSNENKPALTDRLLVRFDFTFVNSEGVAVTAFSYAVIGVPRGTVLYSVGGDPVEDIGLTLAEHLIGALGVKSDANTLGSVNLARMLAGES